MRSSTTSHLWCILVCHHHLTIILCCTAVWSQACGFDHKTSFVIFFHLWFIRRPQLFLLRCRFVGGVLLLVYFIRTVATVTIPVLVVLVNTL